MFYFIYHVIGLDYPRTYYGSLFGPVRRKYFALLEKRNFAFFEKKNFLRHLKKVLRCWKKNYLRR